MVLNIWQGKLSEIVVDTSLLVNNRVTNLLSICVFAIGGDLEAQDDDGSTPLFHAAFWRHAEVAKTLIAAGAR
jgi:ankyrin repeat protein